MFAISIIISFAHAFEELYGSGGPLWRYFGRIAWLRIPDIVGFVSLIILPTLMLWAFAFFAYVEHEPWAWSVLFGARVGDAIVNHGLLWLLGNRPNPGIATASLYAVEAAGIAWWLGVSIEFAAIGLTMFAGVMPAIWTIKKIKEHVK